MSEVVVVGSYVQDLAFRTSVFPQAGETRIGTFLTGVGGKGFNQAVAAHRQGVDTLFLGALGRDGFAAVVRDFADKEALPVRFEEFEGVSTGAASIIVNEVGENLIVVALGANERLSPGFIEQSKLEIVSARVLLVQAECNLGAVQQALELAREAGVTCVFNPAPISEAISLELLQLADILVPNESEFAFLLRHLFSEEVWGDEFIEDDSFLKEQCARFGERTLIVTLGDKGVYVSPSDGEDYRVSSISVAVKDTTGAGDAFSGGLVAGLVRFEGDLRRAIEYASVVAGLSTEREGTAPAMPTRKEVEEKDRLERSG